MNNLGNGPLGGPRGTAKLGAPQITMDTIKSSANVVCECGGMIFTEKLFFKKLSALISPSGKEELAPMPIMVCDKCGKVPSIFDSHDMLPPEVKAIKLV